MMNISETLGQGYEKLERVQKHPNQSAHFRNSGSEVSVSVILKRKREKYD